MKDHRLRRVVFSLVAMTLISRPPAWWLNLKSCPEAHVQYATERVAVKMREATGDEYDEMWSRLQASYPNFDTYRQRTARHIPVVVLDRTERG